MMGCDEADAGEAASVGSQLLRDQVCISRSLDVDAVPLPAQVDESDGGALFVYHDRGHLALLWIPR